MTEQFKLGVQPPIRQSGDLPARPASTLEGPYGSTTIERGVICAQRHIHMSPEDAMRFRVRDNYVVRVRVEGERELIFGDVVVRVNPAFRLAMHIDTDEGNAGNIQTGMPGHIEENPEPALDSGLRRGGGPDDQDAAAGGTSRPAAAARDPGLTRFVDEITRHAYRKTTIPVFGKGIGGHRHDPAACPRAVARMRQWRPGRRAAYLHVHQNHQVVIVFGEHANNNFAIPGNTGDQAGQVEHTSRRFD